MKTSSEFEKIYNKVPVQLAGEDRGSAVLFLDGADSTLQLTGLQEMRHHPKNGTGWFDVSVRTSKGEQILLKNAILTSSSAAHHHETASYNHSAEIYPNFVIEGSQNLDGSDLVSAIHFSLPKFRDFFYYKYLEPLDCKKILTDLDILNKLRRARYSPSEDDIFEPDAIYVAHRYPECFRFEIDDRTYKVGIGGKEAFGLHRVEREQIPIASIEFSDQVPFEYAFEAAWEWRRIFVEQSIHPYHFETLSVSGSSQFSRCDVYLPNQRSRTLPFDQYYRPEPAYICFTQWSERRKLEHAHRTWLSKYPQRRQFRTKLEQVIVNLRSRTDPQDIVTLSAAIDGLQEVNFSDSFDKELIESMTVAAHEAAASKGFVIDKVRINSLLGNLRRPSLNKKIKRICSTIGVPAREQEILSKYASNLRNDMAHGRSSNNQVMATARPTVEALLAVCVNFDLVTSGFEIMTEAGNLTMPQLRYRDAMNDLMEIENA